MPEQSDRAQPRALDDQADGDFLSRWSRRKTRARLGKPPLTSTPEDTLGDQRPASSPDEKAPPSTAEPATEPDKIAESVLTDADMPPLDTLGPDADYSGFLSPGVSRDLRRRALAQLFRSASFNVTDGLDDYAEDFTRYTPLGDLITADMRHALGQELEQTTEAGDDPLPGSTEATGGPAATREVLADSTAPHTDADTATGTAPADRTDPLPRRPAGQQADSPADQPADIGDPQDDAEPAPRAGAEQPAQHQPPAAGAT